MPAPAVRRFGDAVSAAKAILLLGATGAGKSPLGDVLEARGLGGRRCVHFDFGRRLRAIDRADGGAGLTRREVRTVRSSLASGVLLDDEHFPIAAKLLEAFLAARNVGPDDFVVLNGLPRHAGQARDAAAIVNVTAVVELRCTPETVRERIRANAGGDRTNRTDDDPAAVGRKLDLYADRVGPLLDHYRAAGATIHTVDVLADTSAERLWRQLNGSV